MEINYDQLIKGYNESLFNNLRNFSTGHDFLETWVPDEDLNRSLFGLFEAADVHGLKNNLKVVLPAHLEKTLDAQWLKNETHPFGELQISKLENGIELVFDFGKADERAIDVTALNPRPQNVQINKKKISDSDATSLKSVKHHSDRKISEAPEAYRASLENHARNITHEGPFEEGSADLETEIEGIGLFLKLGKRGKITEARHQGAKELNRVLLDCFCQLITGLPLQEAAEHGVIRLEYALRNKNLPKPVGGILTPENADPAFRVPLTLIRNLFQTEQAKQEAPTNRNFWSDPIPMWWLQLDLDDRCAKLQEAINSRLNQFADEAPLELEVFDIRNEVRAILIPSSKASAPVLGSQLLKLETQLRAEFLPQLEVLLAEKEDLNKPREHNLQKPQETQPQA